MLHSSVPSPTPYPSQTLLCEYFCIIPKHRSDIKIKNCSRNIETFPHITISRLCPPRVPGEAFNCHVLLSVPLSGAQGGHPFLFLHFFIYFTYSPRPLEWKLEEEKKNRAAGFLRRSTNIPHFSARIKGMVIASDNIHKYIYTYKVPQREWGALRAA